MNMKRIRVKHKHPNQLFQCWLEEWREEAKLKNSNLADYFTKAITSLKKYPLPLKSGRDCMLLQNFGKKLCTMLDKKLEQHLIQKRTIIKRQLHVDDLSDSKNNFSSTVNKSNVNKKIIQSKLKKVNNRIAVVRESGKVATEVELISMQDFDVILLVDNNETSTSIALDKCKNNTTVPFETRHLKVGDFTWIAKCRTTQKELVLPYIVERKRLDDLAASIKDRRFYEQKFRLKQSGIDNIIYLIEGSNARSSMPISVLNQAAINSLVQDKFTVKFTRNHHDAVAYLSIFTKMLTEIYKGKHLIECPKDNITDSSSKNGGTQLMAFPEFNRSSSKIRIHTVKEMFIKQLLQLKGLSLDAVMEIVELYPTPVLLNRAFINAGQNGEKLLADITYGPTRRKFGPVLSQVIYQLYTKDQLV